MYFNAHLEVRIAGNLLKTVVSVKGQNDSQHIGSYCDLVVPLNCRIEYKGKPNQFLTDYPRNLFNAGDPISVVAWYDGFPKLTLFTGFIYDFVEGTPITIKCMDSVYNLNLTTVDVSYTSITLKNLFAVILKDTDVKPDNNMIDLTLEDITFRLMSPAAICEWLKKEIGLNISINGNKLYCNVASNTTGVVKYSTDQNVLDAKLQKQNAVFRKLKVKAWFIREDGTKDSFEVGDNNGALREVFFYKIPRDQARYKQLAKEALLKYQQHKYSGEIETLLYPECELFWKAEYKSIRYPDQSGNYVIISNNFDISEKGYRRKIKLSFLTDINGTAA